MKFAAVDAAYAEDLGKTMMPPVHWVRDAAWRVYNICVSIKEVADQALRMGKYDLAFAKYEDAQTVHRTAVLNNKRIGAVNDEGFHTACDHLVGNCETNIFLVTLKSGVDPAENITPLQAADFVLRGSKVSDMEDPNRWTPISRVQKGRMYYYRGIAFSIKDNDKLAYGNLRKAYQLDSSNREIKRDLRIMARRLKAQTPEDKAAAGTVEAARLRNEPLELEPPVFTPSEMINSERALLLRFGYQGNMLEHIEGSKPVDMKAVADAERAAAQNKAHLYLKKGESSIKWIGGGGMPEEEHTTMLGAGTMGPGFGNPMGLMGF